uniref:Three-finger toxin 3 n=1 Tax=Sistrurus catenatus edwardsii TaxID=8762 RepID=3NX3_SISCA|nr:RecName: Full=Three-finger toxin 3; Flags: Precursor [Sistrurus catenatus edwardsi]ABG27006.1 three finger toxin 3 [Sistrurus catenatus edwardsi]ABZ89720.1 three finger toxin 3 precursor [Sistrurus catenatus edwardsi]
MKTLLLILGVVAFVYLEPGYTTNCFTCTTWTLSCREFEKCPPDKGTCFKRWNSTGIAIRRRYTRGCAAACPNPVGNEKVFCCVTDNCNK